MQESIGGKMSAVLLEELKKARWHDDVTSSYTYVTSSSSYTYVTSSSLSSSKS
jgi:hypothetical protein